MGAPQTCKRERIKGSKKKREAGGSRQSYEGGVNVVIRGEECGETWEARAFGEESARDQAPSIAA